MSRSRVFAYMQSLGNFFIRKTIVNKLNYLQFPCRQRRAFLRHR